MYFQVVLVTSLVHDHGLVGMERTIALWRENVIDANVDTKEIHVVLANIDGISKKNMSTNAFHLVSIVLVVDVAAIAVVVAFTWDSLKISTIIMTSCNSHIFMIFLDFTGNQFNSELIKFKWLLKYSKSSRYTDSLYTTSKFPRKLRN